MAISHLLPPAKLGIEMVVVSFLIRSQNTILKEVLLYDRIFVVIGEEWILPITQPVCEISMAIEPAKIVLIREEKQSSSWPQEIRHTWSPLGRVKVDTTLWELVRKAPLDLLSITCIRNRRNHKDTKRVPLLVFDTTERRYLPVVILQGIVYVFTLINVNFRH